MCLFPEFKELHSQNPARKKLHPTNNTHKQAYVYHFYGHYIFVPLFFSGTCVRWIAPNRWRLPTAQMDRLATSIRVIARLLWTVHLDYSEAVRVMCGTCARIDGGRGPCSVTTGLPPCS